MANSMPVPVPRILDERYVYLEPHGTPLYWQHETSGRLPDAVRAYYSEQADESQLVIVRDYVRYVVHAPCWRATASELESIRRMAKTAAPSYAGILEAVEAALALGIDPL